MMTSRNEEAFTHRLLTRVRAVLSTVDTSCYILRNNDTNAASYIYKVRVSTSLVEERRNKGKLYSVSKKPDPYALT